MRPTPQAASEELSQGVRLDVWSPAPWTISSGKQRNEPQRFASNRAACKCVAQVLQALSANSFGVPWCHDGRPRHCGRRSQSLRCPRDAPERGRKAGRRNRASLVFRNMSGKILHGSGFSLRVALEGDPLAQVSRPSRLTRVKVFAPHSWDAFVSGITASTSRPWAFRARLHEAVHTVPTVLRKLALHEKALRSRSGSAAGLALLATPSKLVVRLDSQHCV